MNIYPTTRIVFDRRKNSGTKKEGKVKIEVYFKAKRKWISTGVSVLHRNWSDKKYVVGRADSIELNIQIKTIRPS